VPRARGPLLALSAATSALLLAVSGRYGYHRDELYFLAAGRHLDWGYPDQPPLVPLLARLVSSVAPNSLVALRVPSAVMAGAVVLLAGLMAHRLGARRGGQVLAAAATALTGATLALGHLLSTATASLLGWTVVTYLVLLLLQGGDRRLWLLVGLAAGLTAQANVLVGFLLLGLAAAWVLAGRRSLLRSRGPWLAGCTALVLASPYLFWQARHGWPQLDVASHIAAGGSGSAVSRTAFLPLVVLQVGPWLLPIWLLGLVRLLRDATLRCLAVAFLLLLLVFLVSGGKPYYVAGLVPLLLAAGAQPFLDGIRRPWVAPALLALSAPAVLFALPVLPASAAGPVLAVNPDLGETIGWPDLVREVAAAHRTLPPGTAILTGNYGEAGAVDRYGEGVGLPAAFSGHNGYGLWGPPPGSAPVLAVGLDGETLQRVCRELRPVGRITSPHGIDNDEDGAALHYCVPRGPWRDLWPDFRHLG